MDYNLELYTEINPPPLSCFVLGCFLTAAEIILEQKS